MLVDPQRVLLVSNIWPNLLNRLAAGSVEQAMAFRRRQAPHAAKQMKQASEHERGSVAKAEDAAWRA